MLPILLLLIAFSVQVHAQTCSTAYQAGPCIGGGCGIAGATCVAGSCCLSGGVVGGYVTTTCVDLLNPQTGTSDCPTVAYLCQNSVYYSVMTQQCPRTCGRCGMGRK